MCRIRQILSLGVGNRQAANFKALYPNATDEGIDLLRQLLVVEPEKRICAEAALRHDFIKEFLIQFDEQDETMMEHETSKFDFGFESEVRRRIRMFGFSNRTFLFI